MTDQPIPERTTATASAPVLNTRLATPRRRSPTSRSARRPVSIDATRSETNPGTVTSPSGSRSRPRSPGNRHRHRERSATLGFTAYLDDAFNGRVDVSDTATLVDRNGDTATAVATVAWTETPQTPRSRSSRPSTFPRPRMLTSGSASGSRVRIQQPIRPSSAGRSPFPRVDPEPVHRHRRSPFTERIYLCRGAGPRLCRSRQRGGPPLGLCDTFEGEVANARLLGTLTIVKEVAGRPLGRRRHGDGRGGLPGHNYDQTLTVTPGTPSRPTRSHQAPGARSPSPQHRPAMNCCRSPPPAVVLADETVT